MDVTDAIVDGDVQQWKRWQERMTGNVGEKKVKHTIIQ